MSEKIVIYQVLPRLFGNENPHCVNNGTIIENGCGKFSDFSLNALSELKKIGITHLWYTGILEHGTKTDYRNYGIKPDHPAIVKGEAGSPYAIKDYFDVDPDLAENINRRMNEFESLVQRTHQAGMSVIIDFVPNHVFREYFSDQQPDGTTPLGFDDDHSLAFSPYNNFYYIPETPFQGQFDLVDKSDKPYSEYPAKVTGNNCFTACPTIYDWYETVKLNYGVDYQNGGVTHFEPIPDTWHKMLEILFFWASKNIDGFRCDMVEMVPVEFWNWAISNIKLKYPHIIFIAEVYQPNNYRDYIFKGHFDYLYDKVGLYDTLRDVICKNAPAKNITYCWQSLSGLDPYMLNFLENHDEQRIASTFFAGHPTPAFPAMVISACMNTNPVMIYFGQEFGEHGMDSEGYSGKDGRTSIFDYWSIDSIRRWRNHGRYSTKQLTAEEIKTYSFYQRLLNLCQTEIAIRKGQFYDLTYANLDNIHYNSNRLYSFVRKFNQTILLFVVNFDSDSVNVGLNIPKHLFDFLNVPEQTSASSTDLFTNENFEIAFTSEYQTLINVPGYGARILKIGNN